MQQSAELVGSVHTLSELLLRGMGSRSEFHLRVAMEAASREGVGGVIAIQIPSKGKGLAECVYTTGVVEISARWPEVAA